jgi:hypothetical protein
VLLKRESLRLCKGETADSRDELLREAVVYMMPIKDSLVRNLEAAGSSMKREFV